MSLYLRFECLRYLACKCALSPFADDRENIEDERHTLRNKSESLEIKNKELKVLLSKREKEVILSADQLLEAESLQIGASIVASRGPARGLRPVHNFSIQFNSI